MVQLNFDTPLFTAKQKTKGLLLSSSLLIAITTSGCWEVTKVKEAQAPIQTEEKNTDSDSNTDQNINNESSKSNKDKQVSPTSRKIDKKTQEVIDLQKTPAIPKIVIPEGGKPIYYNTQSWYKKDEELTPLKLNTVGWNPQEIANVVSTDENSLDFTSHSATKYRFMENNAPYFDLVDSSNYLEIGWYYANPSDSNEEKQNSLSHAKKAHKFARRIMGDIGGQVVTDMLAGKIVHEQNVNGAEIALAKCQFYSCMLVLKKPKPIKSVDNEVHTEDNNDDKALKPNTRLETTTKEKDSTDNSE